MDTWLIDALFALGGAASVGAVLAIRGLMAPKPASPPVRHEHVDEFLIEKDGVFVPHNPPMYVPSGMHPTIAARNWTKNTGIRHSTRRCE